MQSVAQTVGEILGTVVLVQENRFRIDTEDGRSMLFVLGKGPGPSLDDLALWADEGRKVLVRYRGDPLEGPVAEKVRPI